MSKRQKLFLAIAAPILSACVYFGNPSHVHGQGAAAAAQQIDYEEQRADEAYQQEIISDCGQKLYIIYQPKK